VIVPSYPSKDYGAVFNYDNINGEALYSSFSTSNPLPNLHNSLYFAFNIYLL
jgi:hypothetical protein